MRTEKRAQVIGCLVEGMSIRATVRMTGRLRTRSRNCWSILARRARTTRTANCVNLPCKTIQCDEIWNFVYTKQKNVPEQHKGKFGYGDVWTWTAICADTKLIPSWLVGQRNAEDGFLFMMDLKHRLRDSHVQMTTDGLRAYSAAIGLSFGTEVDWAVLQKHYGADPSGERRYSPGICTGMTSM